MSRLHEISGCKNNERLGDVVFVHGLGGDPFKTWRHGKDESTSWPHWLGEAFPNVGVWSLGYAASPTIWAKALRLFKLGSSDSGHSMALPHRALQVLDLMIQSRVGERPLFFICHSLGGLMVKQLLRKSSDSTDERKHKVVGQTRAVMFLATPHAGAALASIAHMFRTVFGATVSIEDLRAHDAHLQDLFDWYRNHAPRFQIETVTYFELQRLKGMVPIVNPTSAHPAVGADPVGLQEDHLSIAKPRNYNAQVCCAASDLIRDYVLGTIPTVLPELPLREIGSVPSNVVSHQIVIKFDQNNLRSNWISNIPCEFPPSAHIFFGRITQRQKLLERLCGGLNSAVVGPAGLGKTALAATVLKEFLGENGANIAISPFPDGMVYIDLYAFHGQAEPTWNALANRICGSDFMDRKQAKDRATEACRGRRILVILEGGEEADGSGSRSNIPELLSVLSPENRWLLLTRLNTQAAMAETIVIKDALSPEDSAELLNLLTQCRPLHPDVCDEVLEILAGHPLALNWAGNLLARDEEDPRALVTDWRADDLPKLNDPTQVERTLSWLFKRSVRGLGETERMVLLTASLLAHAPFSLDLIDAAVQGFKSNHGNQENTLDVLKILSQRGLLRRVDRDCWQFTHVLAYRFAHEDAPIDVDLLQRLGQRVHNLICKDLDSIEIGELAEVLNNIHHSAALVMIDKEKLLWEPLIQGLLYDIADRFEEIGRLDLVSAALDTVSLWWKTLPASKATLPYWLSQYCVLLVDRGDMLRDQGDLAGALMNYEESLNVRQRLATTDPSNEALQRDLSVSQDKVGNVFRDQGNLEGALAAYLESLAVSRRLADADPSKAGLQRDLSVSLDKVGNVLRVRGDLAGALMNYEESLKVRQRLAVTDSSNTDWQRDLSVSYDNVGHVLRARNDLYGALKAYRESLAVRKRLLTNDPSNTSLERLLSVSYNNIGNLLWAQDDCEGALKAFRESLTLRRRLVDADPSNRGWQRDLSVSHNNVGNVLRAQGDLSGALKAYQQSLTLRQKLVEFDSLNAGWQRDLSFSQEKVGNVLWEQGNSAEALKIYCELLGVRRRLVESDSSNAGWQRDLSYSLTRLAEFHEQKGDFMASLPLAIESLDIDKKLHALNPKNTIWQQDLKESSNLVARIKDKIGKDC